MIKQIEPHYIYHSVHLNKHMNELPKPLIVFSLFPYMKESAQTQELTNFTERRT